nr:hypothetical protein [Rhizobium sp. ACO-34A]
MARRAMILLPLILAMLGNKGCQTTAERLNAAGEARGRAQASTELPALLPAACTEHIRPVARRAGDYATHIIGEYERVIIPGRNRLADDCAAWWADYRARLEGQGNAAE